MPSVFITGAGGGLGREFVRQYTQAGWDVLAPTRAEMDVTDETSIAAYVASLPLASIDVLINNAGVRNALGSGSVLGQFTRQGWLPTLEVNVLGPALTTQALLPHLRRGAGKKIVTLSSRLGSFGAGGGANSGGAGSSYYAYRASKSAVNQLGRCLAIDLGPEGFICALFDPGWVRTPMGGDKATLGVEESVTRMRALIDALQPSDNGRFIALDGGTTSF